MNDASNFKDEIDSMEKIGSLMPPTAQSLSSKEIADLMAYLFSLLELNQDNSQPLQCFLRGAH